MSSYVEVYCIVAAGGAGMQGGMMQPGQGMMGGMSPQQGMPHLPMLPQAQMAAGYNPLMQQQQAYGSMGSTSGAVLLKQSA